MFKDQFVKICNAKGVSPSAACKAIGLSHSTYAQWDDESVPRRATLQKFADYFEVSVDYLLGKEEEKKTTAEDGELVEDVIIYHRDGKTKRKKLTKEQMDMLATLLESLPDDGEGL